MLTGEMHGLFLVECVTVAMLILANGFFVAAEFALVTVRETRIEQMLADRVPGARAVLRLQRELNDFLPAVQLGVTLCSLALGWVGEPLAAGVFLNWMRLLPHAPAHANLYAHVGAIVAVVLGFCVITYLHVVLGELVPKSLALRRAEALAVAVAPPMLLFMALARPGVRVLSLVSRGCSARIRHSYDRAGHRALARGTQADRHRRPPHGPASEVSGDAHPPRPGTGRGAGARNHDPAAEDLRPAFPEHAGWRKPARG